MNQAIVTYVMRALRTAVAAWVATRVAHNVWWAPVVVVLGKVLRDRFPGKVEQWLPI